MSEKHNTPTPAAPGRAAEPTWEYCCVRISEHEGENLHRLNALGAVGWELTLATMVYYWLKRSALGAPDAR